MNTLEAIAKRKSVRNYTSQPVEVEKIATIATAGNSAAIAGQIHFTVITNAEVLSVISETAKNVMLGTGNDFLVKTASIPNYNPIYGAPVMVVVSAPATDDPMTMGMNAANAACAAQNMLLAATELGLGSCYVVSPTLAFMVPEVKANAGIADNLAPACAVVIGYTEDNTPHAERPANPGNINFCQ